MMTMQYIMAGGHDSFSLSRVEGNGFKCFQKEGLMGLDCLQSELCKVQMLLWIHRGSERANLPLSVTCAHSSLCELATYANGARDRRWFRVCSAVCCVAIAITPSLGFGLDSGTTVHTWLGVSSQFPRDAFSRPWLMLPPLLHQHGAKKKKEKKLSSSIRTGQRASAAFQQATRVTKPSVQPEKSRRTACQLPIWLHKNMLRESTTFICPHWCSFGWKKNPRCYLTTGALLM